MASQNDRILDWFYRQYFPAGELHFDDLLIDAVKGALGKSQIEAEALIEKSYISFWNSFAQTIDHDVRRRIAPLFRVVSSSNRAIEWFAHSNLRSSDARDRRLGNMLLSRPLVLEKIDLLNSREYEATGSAACQFMGATEVELTPASNDGGIDFLSSLDVRGRSYSLFRRFGNARIVGQSKKYNQKVEISKIREFSSTLDDVRRNNQRIAKLLPAWFRSNHSPIIGWVIAHKGFQSGAIEIARDHGILLSDSTDVAEIVAVSRLLPTDVSPPKRAYAFRESIDKLLA